MAAILNYRDREIWNKQPTNASPKCTKNANKHYENAETIFNDGRRRKKFRTGSQIILEIQDYLPREGNLPARFSPRKPEALLPRRVLEKKMAF
jgi:hypothetical protein